MAKRQRLLQDAKVIAIVNPKGGTAKTTSAVNLGIGLANQGKRVLLVDADHFVGGSFHAEERVREKERKRSGIFLFSAGEAGDI